MQRSLRVPPTPVDVSLHLGWAAAIAKRFARSFRFAAGSHEEADLISTAHLNLCEQATRFRHNPTRGSSDPFFAFRSFATAGVKGILQQEAIRLRNGGTFHTREEKGLANVAQLAPSPSVAEDAVSMEAYLATDGRRPGSGEPLDILIRDEDAARNADLTLPLDLLLACALAADLGSLEGSSHRSFTRRELDVIDERRFWSNVLYQHGYSFHKISKLLRISDIAIKGYCCPRPTSQKVRRAA